MQTYDPTNDSVIQEEIGQRMLGDTPITVLEALTDAREDRHETIRAMVLMIGALTDSTRRELYTALGVHPL